MQLALGGGAREPRGWTGLARLGAGGPVARSAMPRGLRPALALSGAPTSAATPAASTGRRRSRPGPPSAAATRRHPGLDTADRRPKRSGPAIETRPSVPGPGPVGGVRGPAQPPAGPGRGGGARGVASGQARCRRARSELRPTPPGSAGEPRRPTGPWPRPGRVPAARMLRAAPGPWPERSRRQRWRLAKKNGRTGPRRASRPGARGRSGNRPQPFGHLLDQHVQVHRFGQQGGSRQPLDAGADLLRRQPADDEAHQVRVGAG